MKKLLSAMSIILGLGLASAQQTHPATHNSPPTKTLKSAPVEYCKVCAFLHKNNMGGEFPGVVRN